MKTITNLAISNDKANKTRSILIIISIILTTILLMVIGTWGYGVLKTNRLNADKLYGSFYGSYKGVSENQLKEMNLRSEFTQIGKMAYVGEIENDADAFLYSTDETLRNLTNMENQLQEGNFPVKINEIAAQKVFFEKLGFKDAKQGDVINFNYRADSSSKYGSVEFVISGILKDSGNQKSNYLGYVSEDYYKQQLKEVSPTFRIYFRLDESIDINYDTAEEILTNLAEKCGIKPSKVSVNSYYLLWALDPGTETISVCAVIILIVILFSVVVIYNIFQVGITQKIWEYGKLKALGATKKQLRSVILKEGMLLASIGIPVGLILGYIISERSFQWLMNQTKRINTISDMEQITLFSIPVMILVVLLSLFTVRIALQKPMNIVASVSIVEAMRYQESSKKKKGMRKGKQYVSVKNLMLANLLGNWRRTFSTIFTMGLSCVLFVVMANFVGNMDEEYDARKSVEHGQFCIELEYSMNDTAYPENNLKNILTKNPLNVQMLELIKNLDKVTNVTTRKLFVVDESEKGPMTIAVLNREDFNNLKNSGGTMGTLDYDMASKQNAVLFGWAYFMEEEYGYSVNQTIMMTLEDGTKIQTPLVGSFSSLHTDWAITEDTFETWGSSGELTGYIWVDCEEKDIELVQSELNELFAGVDHIEISSYQDALQTSHISMELMKLGVYAFLVIIGLIGFMNMANTMITSIITRKQEFGVLQAIGMTNKQLNQMFQMEGLIFTVGTVIAALLIGIPLGYWGFLYGKSHGIIGLNIYHLPVIEITVMITIIVFLQGSLSYILSKNIKKDSLVERIRYLG